MTKPTLVERFFAVDGPLKVVWAMGVGGLLAATIVACRPLEAISAAPWTVIPFVAALVAAVPLGLLVSTLLAMPILGSLYQAQGLRNGAPYEPGDVVQILRGSHRGVVTGVWDVWPSREQVRLDLGDEARERLVDVFSYTEVLRIRREPPPEECDEE